VSVVRTLERTAGRWRPVMICPRWVGVKAQPIAVEDLIAYLLQALELPVANEAVFEIGGAD